MNSNQEKDNTSARVMGALAVIDNTVHAIHGAPVPVLGPLLMGADVSQRTLNAPDEGGFVARSAGGLAGGLVQNGIDAAIGLGAGEIGVGLGMAIGSGPVSVAVGGVAGGFIAAVAAQQLIGPGAAVLGDMAQDLTQRTVAATLNLPSRIFELIFPKKNQSPVDKLARLETEEHLLKQAEMIQPLLQKALSAKPENRDAGVSSEMQAHISRITGLEQTLSSTIAATEASAKLQELFMHSSAEQIHRQFPNNPAIHQLYMDYTQALTADIHDPQHGERAYIDYVKKVGMVCERQHNTAAFLECGQNLAYFASQLVLVTRNKTLGQCASGVSSLVQGISGFQQCATAITLLKTAENAKNIALGCTGALAGIGMVLGSLSMFSSLFGGEDDEPDYSEATYFYAKATYEAVMEMWAEMRENFQHIQENFEVTWTKLGYMDRANTERFYQMKDLVTGYHAEQLRQGKRHFDLIGQRFNHLEWNLDKITLQARITKIGDEFKALSEKIQNALILRPGRASDDYYHHAHTILNQFRLIAKEPCFSGENVGEINNEAIRSAPEALDLPAFSLTTLSSRASALVDGKTIDYTRSQMKQAMATITQIKPNRIIEQPMGLEHLLPKNDYVDSLEALIDKKDGKTHLIPLDMGGAWSVLISSPTGLCLFTPLCCRGSQTELLLIQGIKDLQIVDYDIELNESAAYAERMIAALAIHEDLSNPALIQPYPSMEPRPNFSSEPDEHKLGNPFVDWWLSLYFLSLNLRYIDVESLGAAQIHPDIFKKITEVIRDLSTQVHLITKIQHPYLYQQLLDNYANTCTKFDVILNRWLVQKAKEIEEQKNRSIIDKFEHIENQLRLNQERNELGLNITPMMNYRDWWDTYMDTPDGRFPKDRIFQYRAINNPFSRFGFQVLNYLGKIEDKVNSSKDEYLKKFETIKLIAKRDIRADEFRFKNIDQCQPTKVKLSDQSIHNFVCMSTIHAIPHFLVPQNLDDPYLAAPDHLVSTVPMELREAYYFGRVELRFRYEITKDRLFSVYGEWSEFQFLPDRPANKNWVIFSRKNFAYDRLIYEGREAIIRFWYGGEMPRGKESRIDRFVNQPLICDYVEWHSIVIKLPDYFDRPAAYLRFADLPELITAENLEVQKNSLRALVLGFKESVANEAIAALQSELDNTGSALSQAVAKMDQEMQFLMAYAGLGAFALQDDAFQRSLTQAMAKYLYTSEAMKACLNQGASGLAEFNRLRPNKARIEALKTEISRSIPKKYCGFVETPLAQAALLLFQELRARLGAYPLEPVEKRHQRLNDLIKGVEFAIDALGSRTGDAMYQQSIRNTLAKSRSAIDVYGGVLEHKSEVNLAIFHESQNKQQQILGHLTYFKSLLARIQALVEAAVISESVALAFSAQFQRWLSLYTAIEQRLMSFAQEYKTTYQPLYMAQMPVEAPVEDSVSFSDSLALSAPEIVDQSNDTEIDRACRRADIAAVYQYLSQASLSDLALEKARQLIPDTLAGQSIRYLLDGYKRREREASQLGIHVQTTLDIMAKALSQLDQFNHQSKPVVFFWGPTGAGKTTAIEYMEGASFYLNDEPPVALKSGEIYHEDDARHGMSSDTSYPTIHPLQARKYDLIDMPGFMDNRDKQDTTSSSPVELSLSLCMPLMTDNLASIQAFVVLVSLPDLDSSSRSSLSGILDTFRQVGRMIKNNPSDLSANLILALSRHDGKRTAAEIVKKLIRLQNGFPQDRDLTIFLQAWTAQADACERIIFMNIFDAEQAHPTRDQLFNKLDLLAPQPCEQYNFEDFSHHKQKFIDFYSNLNRPFLSQKIIRHLSEIKKFEAEASRQARDLDLLRFSSPEDQQQLRPRAAIETVSAIQDDMLRQFSEHSQEDNLVTTLRRLIEAHQEHQAKRKTLISLAREKVIEDSLHHDLDRWAERIHHPDASLMLMDFDDSNPSTLPELGLSRSSASQRPSSVQSLSGQIGLFAPRTGAPSAKDDEPLGLNVLNRWSA